MCQSPVSIFHKIKNKLKTTNKLCGPDLYVNNFS